LMDSIALLYSKKLLLPSTASVNFFRISPITRSFYSCLLFLVSNSKCSSFLASINSCSFELSICCYFVTETMVWVKDAISSENCWIWR
jgi:hypothetical protein